MPEYALLLSPSANRVYAEAAPALTLAELQVMGDGVLGGAIREARLARMGSVDYVVFAGEALDERALAVLSNLSTTLALFTLEGGRLTPLDLRRLDRFDSDLLSIQRYAGKTNETFTRLLLNVTLAASGFAAAFAERSFTVLDPLCGRGTTLNQALMYGFSAAGVELDRKDFDAYAQFIQRWLKDKRLKHRAHLGHVKGHPRLSLDVGLDKASFKEGHSLHVNVVNADTRETGAVFPPRSFDVVVTDAPYGVQHGSSTGARNALARSPLELVSEAAPVWREALRPGGALGIAWNTHVAKREALLEVLARSGFEPCDAPSYRGFKHRVDQSILRDVVVATRAG
jgi:SAM-dependent methyltransferase